MRTALMALVFVSIVVAGSGCQAVKDVVHDLVQVRRAQLGIQPHSAQTSSNQSAGPRGSARDLVKSGIECYERSSYQTAGNYFDAAIAHRSDLPQPLLVQALIYRGACSWLQKDERSAGQNFAEAKALGGTIDQRVFSPDLVRFFNSAR